MSCVYCGGDYCGSSLGGPNMCENSPTYEDVVTGKSPNPNYKETKMPEDMVELPD
jgi:hypothetical protein